MIKTQTVLKVLIGIGLALALLAGGWLLGSRLWGATCGGYGRGMMNGYGSPRAFGADYFSGAGFGQVHRWLADNNLLPQAPGQGGSCGV